MKTKLIVAAALLASVSVLQVPALAQNEGRAQLRLTVVDETSAPVPNANVTVFTMSGPRTVNTDEKGVVVIADLPAEITQWWARTGQLSNADATRLKPGQNNQAMTLHTSKPLTETRHSESGY
jgi:hypothetical protein